MRARKGHARRRARKRLLKDVKGFWGKRSKLVKMASETLFRSRQFAFRDRRVKKRTWRYLWITRIAAASKARGMSYSTFIHGLLLANVRLNRKSLSELAIHSPTTFDELVRVARDAVAQAHPVAASA